MRIACVLLLCGIVYAFGQGTGKQNVHPELNLKALAEPLGELTPSDRKNVDEAIRLIREKKDAEALSSLTNLTRSNSSNSAIRVLRAYVLLELGNLTGALDDATVAEGSGAPAAYRCWFLAQVAFLAGDKPLCRREIHHVGHDSTYGPEAEKLQHRLNGQGGN